MGSDLSSWHAPPAGVTLDANADWDGYYAVVELAEPLGDRRLVMNNAFSAPR